jgi:hypothetical protein
MAKSPGKNCKVSWGTTTKVVGIGTWDMPGISTDLLEATEMGDEWKTFIAGLKDGGEISFEGLFDPADGGQKLLRDANLLGSQISDLRFYVNSASYFAPTTTNPASYLLITRWSVKADKSALITCSFTAKVSGAMELL